MVSIASDGIRLCHTLKRNIGSSREKGQTCPEEAETKKS
jgi:hypothetical protein